MHDSVAGDAMWFVTGGDNTTTISVIKDTNLLTNPSFSVTTLTVARESPVVDPLQPDGIPVTTNIVPFIMKAAESNNTLVACESNAVSATEDDAHWYEIDVSSGTPTLADEGDVSAGNNTYLTYPAIDINANGQIGLSYMESGLRGPFLSVYATGRLPGDPAGTMETPVLVQAGATNYHDYLPGVGRPARAGDFSGISVDTDGTFWIASEFADTEPLANWGTTIGHFTLSRPAGAAASQSALQGIGHQFSLGTVNRLRGVSNAGDATTLTLQSSPPAENRTNGAAGDSGSGQTGCGLRAAFMWPRSRPTRCHPALAGQRTDSAISFEGSQGDMDLECGNSQLRSG
jgi:hypothetical protein